MNPLPTPSVSEKKRKLTTIMERELEPYAELALRGRVLAFDPSSGSANSLPGWAWYVDGKLEEAGLLEIPRTGPIHIRLQALQRAMKELPRADVVAVEQISHYIKGFSKAAVNLHKSIGVIQATSQCPHLVNVAVISWKKLVPEDFLKSDDRDAIGIGYCVIFKAAGILGEQPPDPPWEDDEWMTNFAAT